MQNWYLEQSSTIQALLVIYKEICKNKVARHQDINIKLKLRKRKMHQNIKPTNFDATIAAEEQNKNKKTWINEHQHLTL